MKTENIVFEQGNSQIIKEGSRFFTRTTENEECLESGDFNTLERAKESLGILPTTTENNKLIAEFMGDKKVNSISIEEFIKIPSEERFQYNGWFAEDLQYHSDWNWLMPVVEKIEHIENADFVVYINVECCKITARETYPNLVIIETAKTKIEATYKAIVEFIKWYNQQKK